MNKFSFYEQTAILIPGAVFLFGLMLGIPILKDLFAKDGISVGGLGIFVIISYASGHLLAAFGNVVESVYWHFWGGMPSNWIVGSNPRLLSSAQIVKVEALTAARFGLALPPFADLTASTWFPVFRQIYAEVERQGKSGRGDTFNGNYGLNRSLCATTFALAVVCFIQAPNQWFVGLSLVGASLIYLYRMHRFGVNYAREIYNQFLLLSPEPSQPEKP